MKSDSQPTFDNLDRVMENTESDEEWIEDCHREQSSGQFERKEDRRESHPSRSRERPEQYAARMRNGRR